MQPDQIVLFSIYRQRNLPFLNALLGQLPPHGRAFLWCLDEAVPDSLSDCTVGWGPGTRWELLNRLVTSAGDEVGADDWIVVADDDVYFSRGDILRLVTTAARAGFDLAQPAHAFLSTHTYTFNNGRRFSRARLVGFVEIGPLFVVGPRFRDRFIPFPEDDGMGWGTEIHWSAERRLGARLGLVDSCRIVHCGPVATGYSKPDAEADLRRTLDRHGMGAIEELLETHGTWNVWERAPAWVHREF